MWSLEGIADKRRQAQAEGEKQKQKVHQSNRRGQNKKAKKNTVQLSPVARVVGIHPIPESNGER